MEHNIFANFSYCGDGLAKASVSMVKLPTNACSEISASVVEHDDGKDAENSGKVLLSVSREIRQVKKEAEEEESSVGRSAAEKREAKRITSSGQRRAGKLEESATVKKFRVAKLPSRVERHVKQELEIEDMADVKTEVFSAGEQADFVEAPTVGSAVAGPPANWEAILDLIRDMRIDRNAPVDLLGPQQLMDPDAPAETQRFHALVAGMISSQTRDAVTAAAMRRLHALPGGLTVNAIEDDRNTIATLAEVLKPVGFYRQKAKHLKGIAQILSKPPYNGTVPSELEELIKLPGVGPKVALLVMCVAFGRSEEGIIVDTNVRRVCCRLGWVPEKSSPEQTRKALEPWLPRNFWRELSFLFVGFGQQVCKPVSPQCAICKAQSLCPSAFMKVERTVGGSRTSKKRK